MQHHGGVPVPCGVLVVVACVLEVDVGGHGECSPGGFVLGQAAGQQGVEVGVGFVPCTGGLVQFVGHVIADGLLGAVVSPLAVAVVVIHIAACLRIHSILIADLEAENVFVEVVVKGGGVHLNSVVSGIGVVGHRRTGTAQLLQSLGIIFQQFTYAVILGAIGFPVVVQNVVVVGLITLGRHILLQSILDILVHQGTAGVGKGTIVIILFNILAVLGLFVGKGGSVFVFVQNSLSIFGGLNIALAEAAVVMIAGFHIIPTAEQFHLGTSRHIRSGRLSGQLSFRIKELVLIMVAAVLLQCSIHQVLHAAGRSVFIVLQLKVRIASIFLRQLLPIKALNSGISLAGLVRGGNSQAVVLVHISMLGAVGQGNIKHGRATRLVVEGNTLSNRTGFLIVVDIERVRCTVKINGLFAGLAVLCVPQGVIHPLGTRISLKPLVELLLAVFLHDFLHLAQFDGLVALGIFLDIEGDLEVAGVLVIGNGVVQIFLRLLLGLLFGLFLRGLLRAGTFLALFLSIAGVSIAGAGGLLAGIALIFGFVLVLALDVVLVVLGGAGQGLNGVGLLRALNGGFVVRRGIVTVALAVGGLVGVVTGGSDRLFFGLSVIRRGVGVRIAVGQRDNSHLQAGVIRVGQGFGCGGTAHANRAAEHRKGQGHRNDLLLLGLFSHNRPPHFTRDCVPRTIFQKPTAQNGRPLGSPYNFILYTFSKNFKGVIARKKACTEISAD